MTGLGLPRNLTSPSCRHADAEEFANFVKGRTTNAHTIDLLIGSRKRFVQHYPDLRSWFAAPLTERVGRLQGESWRQLTCQVSYRARIYLMFLASHGYAPLDWEWLIAVREMKAGYVIYRPDFSTNFPTLVEEAIALGYKPVFAQTSLQWAVYRLFLHLGTTQVEQIQAVHLLEFAQALERFHSRSDVACFFGSAEYYARQVKYHHSTSLQVLQNVLYHRGQVDLDPPHPTRQRTPPYRANKPRMEAVVTRYLTARRLTEQPGTVKHYDEVLHYFINWLAQTYPTIETFAQVTRDHLMEYAEVLGTMKSVQTHQPLAAGTKRGRLSRLSVFFNHIASWGWDDAPTRPLLQHGDLPLLPQRVPRYIPDDELERLMGAVRELICPYQRAALLIARWSGARREEIQRLSVDCLDTYPDGTPRLRIPAGKTRRERLIPLNQEAADAIGVLQALRKGERGLRDRQTGVETRYLFVHYGKLYSVAYLFTDALEKACGATGLVTAHGKAMVTAHRFRHTVGTVLARRGARLRTIQKILGHESASMSMVYIGLTDEDVRKDYQAVLGPGALIAGPGAEMIRSNRFAQAEVAWLKENYFQTELELGRCLRLPQEGPCECDLYLTCAKFVTTPAYAPRLRRRQRIEQGLIEEAQAHGWQREVERHRCTIQRIEQLLMGLNEPLDGPEAIE